jgi:hypothetical protein
MPKLYGAKGISFNIWGIVDRIVADLDVELDVFFWEVQFFIEMAELNSATMNNNALARENAQLSESIKYQGNRLEGIERAMIYVVLGRELSLEARAKKTSRETAVDAILTKKESSNQIALENQNVNLNHHHETFVDAPARGNLSEMSLYKSSKSSLSKAELAERIVQKSKASRDKVNRSSAR